MTNGMLARKLLHDIEVKKQNWNERSQFSLKKVKNLSLADLNTLELYANTFLKQGNINGLRPLYNEMRKVFEAYGLCPDPESRF